MKKMRLITLFSFVICAILMSCNKNDGIDNNEPQVPKTYSVVLRDVEGGTIEASSIQAEKDTPITLTATPDEGFLFGGWSVNLGDSESKIALEDATANPVIFIMPDANVKVQASFIEIIDITNSITITNDGYGLAEASKQSAEPGETITVTAIPDENYLFSKWEVLKGDVIFSDDTANPSTFTMPGEAVEIKAVFVERKYNIVVTYDENGTASANITESLVGEEVTIIAMPESGYRLDAWVITHGEIEFPNPKANPLTFTMPAENIEIRATFTTVPSTDITINGVTWARHNVGVYFLTPEGEGTGQYYQFDRPAGWGNFLLGVPWPSTPYNSIEWQSKNSPCPEGYVVPTADQLATLLDTEHVSSSWSPLIFSNGYRFTDKATNASLFLPAGGYYNTSGTLGNNGAGRYWSSTAQKNSTASYLGFNNAGANMSNGDFRNGFLVRCVRPSTGPIVPELPAEATLNGVTWAGYNVDGPGTFTVSAEEYGMLYPFDSRTGWSVTQPLTSSPANAKWDRNENHIGWTSENNPCPMGWRVPVNEEMNALCNSDKIESSWTTRKGVTGRLFTDKNTGESIFLPAAGHRDGGYSNPSSIYGLGEYGHYWASMRKLINEDLDPGVLYFSYGSSSPNYMSNYSDFSSMNGAKSVRCVKSTRHSVKFTQTIGGSAKTDYPIADGGIVVTITATPHAGYIFDKWSVVSGDVILMHDVTENALWLSDDIEEVHFAMPAHDVEIRANFIPIPIQATINGVEWAGYNVAAPGLFVSDAQDCGMYYQFNYRVGWSSTNPATTAPAGMTWHKYVFTGYDGDKYWNSSTDPCPTGWRVPTKEELLTLGDTEKVSRRILRPRTGYYEGVLLTDKTTLESIYLPYTGIRQTANSMWNQGVGYYGSNITHDGYTKALIIPRDINTEIKMYEMAGRENAYTIRCVRSYK